MFVTLAYIACIVSRIVYMLNGDELDMLKSNKAMLCYVMLNMGLSLSNATTLIETYKERLLKNESTLIETYNRCSLNNESTLIDIYQGRLLNNESTLRLIRIVY